jgi:ABC-type Fe3+-hydroxamate transport system substrate-binding protein
MRYSLLLATSTGLLLAACGSSTAPAGQPAAADKPAAATTDAAGWVDADLSTTAPKLPLVVKAPKGYTVAQSPLGDVELTTDELSFDVDDVTALGADQLKTKKEDVMRNSGMAFEKLVLDQPDGFIAQMGGGNYIPVRLVKVGGKTYQFSTIPLNAMQSEEAARQVYDMAALAKTK